MIPRIADCESRMKATIYRWKEEITGLESWRPRSLVDMRGARFPEEYEVVLVLPNVKSETDAFEQYQSRLGDLLMIAEDDDIEMYVAGPNNWETVKFGSEWRSPE